ncbi:hypothetical protein BC831DRAFT_490328 [Entophlyctis helioformis]|nr:hypothetical protein BC831DRAFT_490328 [Entophlyctis helioformis]
MQLSNADIVMRHLSASDHISLINEYTQKHNKPLPVWNAASTSNGLTYKHSMSLTVDGQRFDAYDANSKQDARRAAATMAVDHFVRQGVPFFKDRLARGGFVNMLQMACSSIGWPMPEYQFSERYNEMGIAVFSASVSVKSQTFHTHSMHKKKQSAKEDVAKIAFETVVNDQDLFKALMSKNSVTIVNNIVKNASSTMHALRTPSSTASVARSTTPPSDNSAVQAADMFMADLIKASTVARRPSRRSAPSSRELLHQQTNAKQGTDHMDLLARVAERHPQLGMPHYNYRPIFKDDAAGGRMFKAQLVFNGKSFVSKQEHPNQRDAAQECARTACEELQPTINDPELDALFANGQQPNEQPNEQQQQQQQTSDAQGYEPSRLDVSSKKRKIDSSFPQRDTEGSAKRPASAHGPDADDDNYTSEVDSPDAPRDCPSYTTILTTLISLRGLSAPVFEYTPRGSGYVCLATLAVSGSGALSAKSMRPHYSKRNAKEDACHDLLIALQKHFG